MLYFISNLFIYFHFVLYSMWKHTCKQQLQRKQNNNNNCKTMKLVNGLTTETGEAQSSSSNRAKEKEQLGQVRTDSICSAA